MNSPFIFVVNRNFQRYGANITNFDEVGQELKKSET